MTAAHDTQALGERAVTFPDGRKVIFRYDLRDLERLNPFVAPILAMMEALERPRVAVDLSTLIAHHTALRDSHLRAAEEGGPITRDRERANAARHTEFLKTLKSIT